MGICVAATSKEQGAREFAGRAANAEAGIRDGTLIGALVVRIPSSIGPVAAERLVDDLCDWLTARHPEMKDADTA